MYCKNCGKEISDTARFCDNCGTSIKEKSVGDLAEGGKKSKKKKRKPLLGIVLLVLGIFMFIGAIGGGSDEPTKVSDSNPETIVQTDPPVFTVGDRLEMDGVYVTLNGVYENNGNQFMSPAEGNVYVVCEFTIENETDSEIAVSTMMSFDAYFDDYAAEFSLGAITSDDSRQQLDGSIAPGKKIKGITGFEAPADWKTIDIEYKVNPLYSDYFAFSYSK